MHLFFIMSKSPLHFSLIQYDIAWEHPSKNLIKLDQILAESDIHSDVLFLPEMFTTGFTMNAPAMAEPMDGTSVEWMQSTARKYQMDVAGSLIIAEDGRFYNRLIWMSPDGIKATYDKRHLFTLAGEDKVYEPGKEKVVVTLKGWNFSPMICYDLRFPVWCRTNQEVDVLLFVANWPDKRVYAWKQLLIARAIENQAYVIGLNRVGWDGEQHYHNGASGVIDPMGKQLLSLGSTEGIQDGKLDGALHQITRTDLPFLNDADSFQINL